MRVSIQLGLRAAPAGDLTFGQYPGGGLPSLRSLALSVFLHGIAVAGVAMISFSLPSEIEISRQPTRGQPTVIRIGDRLYLVSRISALPRPDHATPVRREIAKVKEPILPIPSVPEPRPFVPPEMPKNSVSDATLIQPLSPPDLVPDVSDLPSLSIWTAQVPKIPRPFVAPGQRLPTPVESPAVLPQPDLEFGVADSVVPGLKSALILLPAPATLKDTPPDAGAASPSGNPAKILSLNDHPAPPAATIVVPPGNIAGRTGEVLTTAPAGGSTNADTAPVPSGWTVIVRPAGGHFDAVVVQSTSLDQFPEGKDLLTGRPIYTVYIPVGSPKDWALYFCVPGEKPPPASVGPVVDLGPPVAPLQAPYPTRLVRPGIGVASYYNYMLVHGYVTAAGRFADLRVVKSIEPDTDAAVIASLAGWEFRAATKDGVAITVEFLLSIPVSGL